MILFTVAWALFIFVFPLYSLVLMVVFGPMGIVGAFFSTLHLSRKVVALILKMIFFPRIQAVMFDAVLSREGLYDLVFNHNLGNEQSNTKLDIPELLLNKILPKFLIELTLLVLQFVPIMGPIIVLTIRAPTKASELHKRYYVLMNWTPSDIYRCYWKYHLEYLQFGLMVFLLEMVPGFTFFFMFTNNVGMALWTIDHHKDLKKICSKHRPRLQESTNLALAEVAPSSLDPPSISLRRREYLKYPLNTVRARIWTAGRASLEKHAD